jgi:hypothetical protein
MASWLRVRLDARTALFGLRRGELIFIARRDIKEPIEKLRKSAEDLEGLSAPHNDRWKIVRQNDDGYSAWQRAKKSGVADPDHEPFVVDAYLNQSRLLACAALDY